jgi:nucleoid-associated protein YgaU
MKRDVQVGVVLGVIILAIIGVFLSTRTPVKEPVIPIPEIEETQVGIFNINELTQEPPDTSQSLESGRNVAATTQETDRSRQEVSAASKVKEQKEQPVAEQDTVIEGVYENITIEEPEKTARDDKKAALVLEQESAGEIVPAREGRSRQEGTIHKVQQNETLRKIAEKYYGDESRWLIILNANQEKIHDRNNIQIGTELVIPEVKEVSQKVKEEAAAARPSQRVTEATETKPSGKKHIVGQGESLFGIAQKYYNDGSKWYKILEANKKTIKDRKSLKVGQELFIPDP